MRCNATTLAKKNISWALVINELARLENIDVDYKEVDKEIEKILTGLEEKEEKREYLNNRQSRQNIYELLKARKTVKSLAVIVQNKMYG